MASVLLLVGIVIIAVPAIVGTLVEVRRDGYGARRDAPRSHRDEQVSSRGSR
jgi:hypothetical protein